MRLAIVAVLAAVATIIAVASSSSFASARCMMHIHNSLTDAAVNVCGRHNAGVPGASWFSHFLTPGATLVRPCAITAGGQSYELYFTTKNDTACVWDSCKPNTGTCKSYPWNVGVGELNQDALWYGYVAQNFDGNIGYTGGSYKDVGYGVKMNCMSYGTKPWNATCGVSADGRPVCSPNHPVLGKFADSGVVACGPKGSAQIYVELTESL